MRHQVNCIRSHRKCAHTRSADWVNVSAVNGKLIKASHSPLLYNSLSWCSLSRRLQNTWSPPHTICHEIVCARICDAFVDGKVNACVRVTIKPQPRVHHGSRHTSIIYVFAQQKWYENIRWYLCALQLNTGAKSNAVPRALSVSQSRWIEWILLKIHIKILHIFFPSRVVTISILLLCTYIFTKLMLMAGLSAQTRTIYTHTVDRIDTEFTMGARCANRNAYTIVLYTNEICAKNYETDMRKLIKLYFYSKYECHISSLCSINGPSLRLSYLFNCCSSHFPYIPYIHKHHLWVCVCVCTILCA